MSGVSRRDLFRVFSRPLRPRPPPTSHPDPSRVAIIQGRHCLAIAQGCRDCVTQCPVPGALVLDAGLPIVVHDTCTGCTVCQQVCPAPTNAVLLIPRR